MPPKVLRDPRPSMPSRQPGSLRRTTHVDVGLGPARAPGPRAAAEGAGDPRSLVVVGAGHEVTTDADGTWRVAETGAVEAVFDAGRRLVRLTCRPEAPWVSALTGERSGGGFRRSLARATPPEAVGSLLAQLLDDLPAALLISGYSAMRLGHLKGLDPARMVPPDVLSKMTDLCSGWRSGGVAVKSIAMGRGVPVQDCPPSTDLEADDPAGWHAMSPLPEHWMRRRRCIDVSPAPGGSGIWAMFRDTVAERDGIEVVLHEYSVSLSIDASGRETPTIRDARALPAVLPFPECPAAAAEVTAVIGHDLLTLSHAVPELLEGVRSCTHLNDLLRSIGGAAPAMVASIVGS